MQRVLVEAERQGVRVAIAALPPPMRAAYLADQELMLISDRLNAVQRAESGAHELGHHYYGDRCSNSESEERAWRYAAKVLVTIESYRKAELQDPHPVSIAYELDTTRRIIELYQQHHLQSQAMAAPRNIFGVLDDEDYYEDSMRHSLKVEQPVICGLGAAAN